MDPFNMIGNSPTVWNPNWLFLKLIASSYVTTLLFSLPNQNGLLFKDSHCYNILTTLTQFYQYVKIDIL